MSRANNFVEVSNLTPAQSEQIVTHAGQLVSACQFEPAPPSGILDVLQLVHPEFDAFCVRQPEVRDRIGRALSGDLSQELKSRPGIPKSRKSGVSLATRDAREAASLEITNVTATQSEHSKQVELQRSTPVKWGSYAVEGDIILPWLRSVNGTSQSRDRKFSFGPPDTAMRFVVGASQPIVYKYWPNTRLIDLGDSIDPHATSEAGKQATQRRITKFIQMLTQLVEAPPL